MSTGNTQLSRQTGFAPVLLLLLVIVLVVGIAVGYILPRYQLVRTEQKIMSEPTIAPKETTQPPTVKPTEKPEPTVESTAETPFTQNAAVTLADSTLGPCGCGLRTVTVNQQGNLWYMTVVDDKLGDDSIKAKRVYAPVTNQNGVWTLGTQSVSYQCWPGRGHQDFSSSLCQ